MTFPLTPILDDFNRDDEGPPPSGSWAASPGFPGHSVVSQQIRDVGEGTSETRWLTSYGPNQEAYITIAGNVNSDVFYQVNLAIRATVDGTATTCYFLEFDVSSGIGSFYLNKRIGEVVSIIGTISLGTISVGAIIGIRGQGNRLSCWYSSDGGTYTQVISVTDDDILTDGYLIVNSTAAILDNFGGGEFVPSVVLPSQVREFNLTIGYDKPLWADYGDAGDVNYIANSYSHTIAADGGFVSAEFALAANMATVIDWLKYGLGRHIEVYGTSGEIIWEGFVDQIAVTYGPLSIGRGPLSEITNRLTVKYTDFLTNTAARTVAANNTVSQEKYGIIHKTISGGTITATNADNVQATALAESAFPETAPTLSTQSSDVGIRVSCLGYGKFFELYVYNQPDDTTYSLREKVLEVISQEPNGVFSGNYAEIEPNTLDVNRLDNDDRTAKTIIDELQAFGGDSNNNRRIFGVLEGRQVYLKEIPSAVEYNLRIGGNGLYVETVNEEIVFPWNIRPGKWLDITDFSVEDDPSISLQQNLSKVFIESVTFTSPFDFSINGGKANTLSQMLAKLATGAA